MDIKLEFNEDFTKLLSFSHSLKNQLWFLDFDFMSYRDRSFSENADFDLWPSWHL